MGRVPCGARGTEKDVESGPDRPYIAAMNETLRVTVAGNPAAPKVVSPSPIANAFIGSDDFPAVCLRTLTEGVRKVAEEERLAEQSAKDARSV